MVSWLDLGDVEADSEGGGASVWVVEEVVEGGGVETAVFLVDFGEDDWGHSEFALESSFLVRSVIGDLAADGGGELGGADEGHDVGEMLEDEDLFGGGNIVGSGSDFDNGSSFQVWEFQLEGQAVVSLTGLILEFELVGVFVKLENLEDLSDNVEIFFLFLGSVFKADNLFISDNVTGGKKLISPFFEGVLDLSILFLMGVFFTGIGEWSITSGLSEWGKLIGGVDGPGRVVGHVDGELSSIVVEFKFSSVNSNNITNSMDEWEILKSVSINNNLSVVRVLLGSIKSWVNNLEDTDESGLSGFEDLFVWEGGVNDNTVEVAEFEFGGGSLGELNVIVLIGGGGLLGWGRFLD